MGVTADGFRPQASGFGFSNFRLTKHDSLSPI